jgi:hypothetical protein
MAGRISLLAVRARLRRELGAAAPARAEGEFSAEKEVRRLREILFPQTGQPAL